MWDDSTDRQQHKKMHTPEGTLERRVQAHPHFHTAPARESSRRRDEGQEHDDEEEDDHQQHHHHHVISMPNYTDQFTNDSMLCIQDELGQLNLNNNLNGGGGGGGGVGVEGGENADHHQHRPVVPLTISVPGAAQGYDSSSPDTPQTARKQGWMQGIFGCLQPVLSIIGKSGTNEIKGNQDSSADTFEIPFEQITDLQWLGCGGQGIVFYGLYKNEPVAVKKVHDIKDTDIKNLRKLNHPNIVKFKGVCTQSPCYCIVMEYCPYGPLYDLLKNQDQSVTPARIVLWAKQIANGMQYLHSHKIIHRDLKSPNVLIGENEVIKISDFGTSRTWNEVSTKMTFAGTVAWMAPEAITESTCSEKVDIWSFGVVLWELLTCEIPYKDMEQNAIIFMVGCGKLRPPIPSSCPAGYKLIMEMCWKLNPKQRPSFKLICNHLEIASVEILSVYKEELFFKTQETWKEEIRSKIAQFKGQQENAQSFMKQLIKTRETELNHIRDIKILYDRKIEMVNQIYCEALLLKQQMQECWKREQQQQQGKRRLVQQPVMKKLERRKCNNHHNQQNNNSTTPTSPECSLTSPDTPHIPSPKAPFYAQLNTANQPESTLQQNGGCSGSGKTRKRHYRNNSGSPRSCGCSNLHLVNTETQTDHMELSETDLSPNGCYPPAESLLLGQMPQRVILQECRRNGSDDDDDDDDEERTNGNCVQLHYLAQHSEPEVQVFTRVESRCASPDDVDTGCDVTTTTTDTVNSNSTFAPTRDNYSDEDNLETLRRKVSAVTEIISATNGNIFDNGNVSEDIQEAIRKRRCSESRSSCHDNVVVDATNDSFTDEEGEVGEYNMSLRRRSVARRPIYPGRRSSRYKHRLNNQIQREVIAASDEGNTSEYSNPPSSKSSTLESNPGGRTPMVSLKRANSDEPTLNSSDSESEENLTIATQLCYDSNKLEKV
ncbi:PREDICTED: mitogen-activated protein kinase kinase kinase 12 isoform X3 [Nicrophorus vespilloides]|uniref:Mitogen-activated protein kinase kinase kinase 12 isoform X3 n=1 Tax=Nicrophorus vespilloides TaxID=110193 RepID=A0ABM1M059_NICVS|nr:PREDICTED: mitogen-activated protein kinase kinase kinase 12 isoform X3 [Nicrophorus vespilloides]